MSVIEVIVPSGSSYVPGELDMIGDMSIFNREVAVHPVTTPFSSTIGNLGEAMKRQVPMDARRHRHTIG